MLLTGTNFFANPSKEGRYMSRLIGMVQRNVCFYIDVSNADDKIIYL